MCNEEMELTVLILEAERCEREKEERLARDVADCEALKERSRRAIEQLKALGLRSLADRIKAQDER